MNKLETARAEEIKAYRKLQLESKRVGEQIEELRHYLDALNENWYLKKQMLILLEYENIKNNKLND